MEPADFCRALMHEYERQWSSAGGHAVRHPLRLKMERLGAWCQDACSADAFEARLQESLASDDPGLSLLAQEVQPLWERTRRGEPLSFATRASARS